MCFCSSAPDENDTIYYLEIDRAELTGIDRDELYIDLSSIRWDTQDSAGTTQRISYNKYMELMTTEANTQLDDYGETINFESTINTSKNLQYKTDFNVGDRVTTIEKNWGIRIDARITKISETWQDGKHTLEVTFGDSLPTLLDKIKKVRK